MFTTDLKSNVERAIVSGDPEPIFDAALAARSDQLSRNLHRMANDVKWGEGNKAELLLRLRHYCPVEADPAAR